MEKILTVVVPAYHVEKYICKNLDSLVNIKNRDKLEVLVVDDGSSDRTGEIADSYAAAYADCVRVIHQSNKGHGGTINTGIKEALGRYFKVVDGDDWVDSPALEALIEKLEKLCEDLVFTDYTEFYENDGTTRSFALPLKPEKTLYPEDMKLNQFILIHYYTVRTEILRKLPYPIDEHCYYADTEYILYPLPFVRTLRYEKLDVYRYRLGRAGQSVSPEGFRKHYKENEKTLMAVYTYYDEIKKLPQTQWTEQNQLLNYYMPRTIFELFWRHELKCMWFLEKEERPLGAYLRALEKRAKKESAKIYNFLDRAEDRKRTLSNLQIRILRLTGFRLWRLVRLKKKLVRR